MSARRRPDDVSFAAMVVRAESLGRDGRTSDRQQEAWEAPCGGNTWQDHDGVVWTHVGDVTAGALRTSLHDPAAVSIPSLRSFVEPTSTRVVLAYPPDEVVDVPFEDRKQLLEDVISARYGRPAEPSGRTVFHVRIFTNAGGHDLVVVREWCEL